jgi:hypothetical protein
MTRPLSMQRLVLMTVAGPAGVSEWPSAGGVGLYFAAPGAHTPSGHRGGDEATAPAYPLATIGHRHDPNKM